MMAVPPRAKCFLLKLQELPFQYNHFIEVVGMSVKLQHFHDQIIYNYATNSENLFNDSKSLKASQIQVIPAKVKRTLSKTPSPSCLRQAISNLRVYFEQFCEKYKIEVNEEEIARLMALAESVKEVAFRNKGNRQLVATVLYCQYGRAARFSNTKEFCRKNGLNVRAFNKKFTIYRKINRIVPSGSDQDDTIHDTQRMTMEQTVADGGQAEQEQHQVEPMETILEYGMQ